MPLSGNCFRFSGVCPSGIGQPHARGRPQRVLQQATGLAASFSTLIRVWEGNGGLIPILYPRRPI
jgi:hypothetical protein